MKIFKQKEINMKKIFFLFCIYNVIEAARLNDSVNKLEQVRKINITRTLFNLDYIWSNW